MSIVCAACGKISRDREFCDHCNADLQSVDDRLPPERCPLPGGEVELSASQRKVLARVEGAVALETGTARWVFREAAPAHAYPWHDRTAAVDPLLRMHELLADVDSLAHTLGQLHRQG